jgi:hypothetical protein
MVDTVNSEMQHKEEWFVGQDAIDVEEESMEDIFQQCPNQIAEEERQQRLHVRLRGN